VHQARVNLYMACSNTSRSRRPTYDFHRLSIYAQQLDLFAWCVRL